MACQGPYRCVGGTHDGVLFGVPEGWTTFETGTYVEDDRALYLATRPPERTLERYHRVCLGEGEVSVVIWVVEGMTREEALRHLVTRYRRQES